jgi:hypothetical protein
MFMLVLLDIQYGSATMDGLLAQWTDDTTCPQALTVYILSHLAPADQEFLLAVYRHVWSVREVSPSCLEGSSGCPCSETM